VQPREEATTIRSKQFIYRPRKTRTGGWVEINPAFIAGFAELGLDSPDVFLELQGEIVSGHPDRHVVRVSLPGFSQRFYLKRQHSVKWREKLRNWRAGFAGVSRSERECSILKQLVSAGLSSPRWAAVGVDGRGRAFLLVEELAGTVDLRQNLSDTGMSQDERVAFAKKLGQWIARYHNNGFTTPELTAKHVLVNSESQDFTLIDWQSAIRTTFVGPRDRFRFLAALHASLAEQLASPRERLRALREATREGQLVGRFSDIVRQVIVEANRIANRRSIRDQRQPSSGLNQKLVWVDGEAVCAVPDVAALWPDPAIAAPYYGGEPGTFSIQLPDGLDALLIRGRSFAPLGLFHSWVRGRTWRSPGVTIGRILFHLERYAIPAPRLLAFGQRFTGTISAEWFALHTLPAGPVSQPVDLAVAAELGRLLRRLHDAGCSVGKKPLDVFGIEDGNVAIRDPRSIRIAKIDVVRELHNFLTALSPWVRKATEASYRLGVQKSQQNKRSPDSKTVNRLIPTEVIQ
jgi:tRNA A-37 threonylcarbamoyl transferase component Bud32